MQTLRFDLQDILHPIRPSPPGLFGQEGQRDGLVQQAQFSVRFFGVAVVGGIGKHAACQQVAMEIRHQRADVARRQTGRVGLASL